MSNTVNWGVVSGPQVFIWVNRYLCPPLQKSVSLTKLWLLSKSCLCVVSDTCKTDETLEDGTPADGLRCRRENESWPPRTSTTVGLPVVSHERRKVQYGKTLRRGVWKILTRRVRDLSSHVTWRSTFWTKIHSLSVLDDTDIKTQKKFTDRGYWHQTSVPEQNHEEGEGTLSEVQTVYSPGSIYRHSNFLVKLTFRIEVKSSQDWYS